MDGLETDGAVPHPLKCALSLTGSIGALESSALETSAEGRTVEALLESSPLGLEESETGAGSRHVCSGVEDNSEGFEEVEQEWRFLCLIERTKCHLQILNNAND